MSSKLEAQRIAETVHGAAARQLHAEALDLLDAVVERVERLPVRGRSDLTVPLSALHLARSNVAAMLEHLEINEEQK